MESSPNRPCSETRPEARTVGSSGERPWVLLYSRAGAAAPPRLVRAALARARALTPPDRLWVVGGPGARLARRSRSGSSPHVLSTPAYGALPLLPALLELGRLSGGDAPCLLVPDDLETRREEPLRRAVETALAVTARTPRVSVVIALPDGTPGTLSRGRILVGDGVLGEPARPVTSILGAGERAPRPAALRDSGFAVGRVSSLLALYKDFLPGAFLALVQAWLAGTTEEALAALPAAALDRDLLARAVRRLRVITTTDEE